MTYQDEQDERDRREETGDESPAERDRNRRRMLHPDPADPDHPDDAE